MPEETKTEVGADASQSNADAQDSTKQQSAMKQVSDEEWKKVIAERDKAKEKARKYEEAEQKRAEQKRIEDGELKAVLAEKEKMIADLQAKASAFETQQNKLRESIIAKVPAEFADVAADIHDIDKLQSFVEKLNTKTQTQTQVFNGKGQVQSDSFTNVKTFEELTKALQSHGLA